MKSLSFDLTRQLLCALALRDRDDAIKAGEAHGFQRAVRPFHFEFVDFNRRAESEMEAGVVLRGVARAAQEVEALAQRAGGGVDDCARRILRAFLRRVADETQDEPVVLGVGDVAQDGGRGVAVVDDSVESPVAVEVCDGEAARRVCVREAAPRRGSGALEDTVVQAVFRVARIRNVAEE